MVASQAASDIPAREFNFDGLVGPTHNYSGLAHGNMASARHRGLVANPREAALQGLAKMKALADAGFAQAVLPPHHRPDTAALAAIGFSGSPAEMLAAAASHDPALLRAVSSAAAMWTANAATVTPSADAPDQRVHFTPANLQSSFHRALEAATTTAALKAIFASDSHFAHHAPLVSTPVFGDEGAANHSRLCTTYGSPGLHFFVYGEHGFGDGIAPQRFRARQTREASHAVARQHGLRADQCVFAQQNPDAIDAGVFHNDVIAVANGPVLFYHQQAFIEEQATLAALKARCESLKINFCPVRVATDSLSLENAVQTYLFNSQLLSLPDGSMQLIVPGECSQDAAVSSVLDDVVADTGNPIAAVQAFDVKQSMQNGGGPACLRLRVVLTETERNAVAANVFMNDTLHDQLSLWIRRHYRDRLAVADLADPTLIDESRTALDELTGLLQLGSMYAFQR